MICRVHRESRRRVLLQDPRGLRFRMVNRVHLRRAPCELGHVALLGAIRQQELFQVPHEDHAPTILVLVDL